MIGGDRKKSTMILTNCAFCAAPLPQLAKQCSRCKTRYCGPACQAQHWKEGGHDKLCKKIKRGGGAEQFHAANKYTEATATAINACADDTKDQTCYICTEGAERRHTADEGLMRMCSCRGTAGFVHVSCLAEQAQVLCDTAEENNLGLQSTWARWSYCSLCKQQYHGVVSWALGWACWKKYLGRPETDHIRGQSLNILASGLFKEGDPGRCEEAYAVQQADLAARRRLTPNDQSGQLMVFSAMANTLSALGRSDEALKIHRFMYTKIAESPGDDEDSFGTMMNFAAELKRSGEPHLLAERRTLLRDKVPVAQRVLGPHHRLTLQLRSEYAQLKFDDDRATLDDRLAQLAVLEGVVRTARQVLGAAHPLTESFAHNAEWARTIARD